MKEQRRELEGFFRDYERNANAGDGEGTTAQFAESFMAADPSGVRVVPAAGFAEKITERKRFFEGLGSRATTLMSLEEWKLDDCYVLAKTRWRVEFDREDVTELMLESSFVMHRSGDGWRIVLYLAHQNLMEVLRERGLLDVRSS